MTETVLVKFLTLDGLTDIKVMSRNIATGRYIMLPCRTQQSTTAETINIKLRKYKMTNTESVDGQLMITCTEEVE